MGRCLQICASVANASVVVESRAPLAKKVAVAVSGRIRVTKSHDRSYERITRADLARLDAIAARDRRDLFARRPETGRLYRGRLFAVALCQGGALHYIDKKTGIKDFDVWSFFRAHPSRPFPYRRRAKLDFGDPKFGTTRDSPLFTGRRVDHIGRSIIADAYSNPVEVLRRYLHAGATGSARRLSQKALVLVHPARLLGTVVWPGRALVQRRR